jgi:protein-L-isoaspartate(D-aspartate) O-methyltransferase
MSTQMVRADEPAEHDPQPRSELAAQRERMVREQLEARGIREPRVLEAVRKVPREEFVPPSLRGRAYADMPLPLDDETISQPYVVALMCELAAVRPADRVLDVGTGSGYQAAVLEEIGAEVYSIELSPLLELVARRRLAKLGYRAHVRRGDGWKGWPEASPFDAIIVAAGADEIPPKLVEQLAEGGRIVIPLGATRYQQLIVGTKHRGRLATRDIAAVAFVPLVRVLSGDSGRNGRG